ncbi:hypothetical protein Cob_v005496 [Colletotrichum orbiculare MAFF 240422]|uniref:Uncharacterized protein n=1 Tax=Colletotrichum orbiculare (strain 104-T / ATCC 96160 / CBS 514.97 / LARS 414 / MAFF 240422) TaxID=1213857 RepID=N4V726_COLOR|nr:hypothetical protein Cob_v005496 [Colletotrichum orbiculare MAFF 240422]
MQFFNAVLVLASLAAAAPAAGDAPAVEARQDSNTPCPSGIQPVWNTGNIGYGDGGWGCTGTNDKGVCKSYYWKKDLPYWSCP